MYGLHGEIRNAVALAADKMCVGRGVPVKMIGSVITAYLQNRTVCT